eukprot:14625104-Alexandrium_andersonii.AAC.1
MIRQRREVKHPVSWMPLNLRIEPQALIRSKESSDEAGRPTEEKLDLSARRAGSLVGALSEATVFG